MVLVHNTMVLVCLYPIWNMVATSCKLFELQGPKFSQNLQSSPFGTFDSHFSQYFARFEHVFYFQKCSPWWALSDQVILGSRGWGGVAGFWPWTTGQLNRWHCRVTCRVAPYSAKARLKTQKSTQTTKALVGHFFWKLHFCKNIERWSPLHPIARTIKMSMSYQCAVLGRIYPGFQIFWTRCHLCKERIHCRCRPAQPGTSHRFLKSRQEITGLWRTPVCWKIIESVLSADQKTSHLALTGLPRW